MDLDGGAEREFTPQKKKKEPSEDEKRRIKIVPGSLMKALMRPGGGELKPSDGDQVVYHCTIRTLDGVVVESTRSEYGGKGYPIRHVLGKSKMLLGLLEGIPTMLKGEVAMFKMKPQMHYGEEDCPLSATDKFPKEDELHFEIEMIDFFKAKVISDDFGVVKKSESEIVQIYVIHVEILKDSDREIRKYNKQVVSEGHGWESPREPYEVKAWISAKTGDGKIILSHSGEPYFFTFGKSEVPKGLEMAIGTMSRGEKATIFVTDQYLTPSPLVSSFEGVEEVHFEVELVHFIQVRDMLGDGRLIKRRIRDGKGEFPMDCPLHDSLLSVHYKAMVLNEKNKIFYDTRIDNDGQPLKFSSGEGLVPEGFEMCVRLMLPEEIALVTCPPDYAYGKFQRPEGVPEGAHVQWEIELLGFEMPKDWTGLNFESIMDEAEKIRNTGNRLFKEGKFELAKAKYEKVLREFNHVNPQDDEEGKVFSNTRNLLHLNVAACYLKLGECRKSIEMCNKVLEANPAHVKGLYRRGMAYMAVGEFEEAKNDFNMMIKVDKSSESDATAALTKLKQKEQEIERKARKQFKGLFDKKPGEISEVGSEDKEEHTASEDQEKHDKSEPDEPAHEAAHQAIKTGWFSRFWPFSTRIFSSLGLNRCSIL